MGFPVEGLTLVVKNRKDNVRAVGNGILDSFEEQRIHFSSLRSLREAVNLMKKDGIEIKTAIPQEIMELVNAEPGVIPEPPEGDVPSGVVYLDEFAEYKKNTDAKLAQTVRKVNGVSPDTNGNVSITATGSGILIVETLSDLQTSYPDGTEQPVWVSGEKSWYYWNEVVVEPPPVEEPSDTTAPIVTASPAAGTYTSAQNVTLSANEAATIYYTLDGTTPTTASSVYSGAIPITSTKTLQFIARDAAGNQSAPVAATYTINIPQTSGQWVFTANQAGPFTTSSTAGWKGQRFDMVNSRTVQEVSVKNAGAPTAWELWSMTVDGTKADVLLTSGTFSGAADAEGFLNSTLGTLQLLEGGKIYALVIQYTATGASYADGASKIQGSADITPKNYTKSAGSQTTSGASFISGTTSYNTRWKFV